MPELEQESIDRLVGAFLGGKLTGEERSELISWIAASAESRKYFHEVKNIWEAGNSKSSLSQSETSQALTNVIRRISPRNKTERFISFLQKAAAIVLLPLMIGGYVAGRCMMHKTEEKKIIYQEVVASSGTRTNLTLADGTQVWLNSGSRLSYPDRFIGKKRSVKLEGEAFFSVKADKIHPFFVEAYKISVKATGTRFNLMAYPGSTDFQVTLVEGSVDVLLCSPLKKEEVIRTMKPNEHLSLDTLSSCVNVSTGDVYKYYAWKDGKLVFRNDPLSEVVNVLNRLYNVEIVIMDDDIKDYRFRATFQSESISDILYLLKKSSPIQYKEYPSKSLPDGSFSKKKILIYKDQ